MKTFNTIYLTEDIFESANKQNNYEALSEKLAKAFLTNLLKVSDKQIMRGNPKHNEPDYVCCGRGYEITFCMNPEIILEMKGQKPIADEQIDIEQQMITHISKATKRKSKKNYSIKTTLFLINLLPNLLSEQNAPLVENISLENYCEAIYSSLLNDRLKIRNQFFNELYEIYIKKNIFEDILIACLTNDRRYIIYSINDFAKDRKFYTYFGIKNNPNIPYCVITNIEKGAIFEPFENLYSIIYAKRN